MKLESGRDASNDFLNTLAEDVVFTAFGSEDLNEGLDATAEALENGGYEGGEGLTEEDCVEILDKIKPTASEAYGKLFDYFHDMVKKDLTKDNW